MFSTGMPLLYLLAAIFYTVLYWVYKFLLLKYYMRTSRFNEGLPISATSTAKVALLFHVMFGGYMVTNSQILPVSTDISIGGNMSDMLEDMSESNAIVEKIMSRFFAIPRGRFYVLFIIIVVVYIIARATVISFVFKCLSVVCFCCKKDKDNMMNEDAGAVGGAANSDEIYSWDFFKDLQPKFLLSLYKKAEDELIEF